MQRRLPAFLLILFPLLFTISSCKKDIAQLVVGTYVVSGTNLDSSHIPVNNAVVEVRKKSRQRIVVSCFNLPHGKDLTIDYDDAIKEAYAFSGRISDADGTYDLQMYFFKSFPDSVLMNYSFWDSTPATVFVDYALKGKRR